MRSPSLIPALALLCGGLALFVALGPLGAAPHITDEVAYTLQARLFAAGQRVGPPTDVPGMLLYPFWVSAPLSYAVFPPGWPALLAVGEVIGLGAWVNPLVAMALPPLIWRLGQEWADEDTARLAAAIIACSPGLVLLAGSRMAHTSTLAGLLLALVIVARGRDAAWVWGLGGLGLGYVLLARPFDGVVLGGGILAAGLWRAPGGVPRALLLLGPGIAAGLTLWDNHTLTGDAFTFPVNPWYDAWVADTGRAPGCNRLGFGPEIGCHPTLGSLGHSPEKAARLAGAATLRLDRLLLGWPGLGLIAVLGAWRLRIRWVSALAVALVVGGYALYWSPGLAYGARFYHPLYALLPLWLAAGLRVILPGPWPWVAPLVALVGLAPVVRDLNAEPYWCVDADLGQLLRQQGITEGVVFLMARGRREVSWPALGVDAFACEPMLESGDGLWLNDPNHPKGGLQLRHALPDAEQTQAYLKVHHPGEAAYLVQHDVATDTRRLLRLTP